MICNLYYVKEKKSDFKLIELEKERIISNR